MGVQGGLWKTWPASAGAPPDAIGSGSSGAGLDKRPLTSETSGRAGTSGCACSLSAGGRPPVFCALPPRSADVN